MNSSCTDHLHHHLKAIFSERVTLWEGARIEDKEVKLCVQEQELPSCPLDARQAEQNSQLICYLKPVIENLARSI